MTRTDEALQKTLKPLNDLYAQLEVEHEQVSNRLTEITVEMKRVQRILNAAEPPKTRKKSSKGWTPAPERMEQAQEFIKSVEDFSVTDLAKAMDVSSSYGNKVCKDLREQGIIRLVRMEKVGPKGAGKMIYKAVK